MNTKQMQVVAELYAENDKLETQNKLLDKKLHELQQENQQLHNKIDKAIEYIEDYGYGYDCTGDVYYCLDEDNQKELLEILKG